MPLCVWFTRLFFPSFACSLLLTVIRVILVAVSLYRISWLSFHLHHKSTSVLALWTWKFVNCVCMCVCVASHIILIVQLRDLQHNLPNMISKLYGHGGGFESSPLAATRFQFNASFNCGKLKAWLATITANWKAYNLWAIIKIGQWDQLTEKFVSLSFFGFCFY